MRIALFSKIRYLLFALLSIMLIYIVYNYGIATLAVLAIVIGTLSFYFNKKVTDYLALSIFIFAFTTMVTDKIDTYLMSESDAAFIETIKNSINFVVLEAIASLLFVLVIVYLSINFIKNK